MMIIQHPNFLGLLHILKHYNLSEFCTVVRCLVFAVLSQNQCHNLVSYFGLKMVPVSKMKNMRYAVVQRPRVCLFLRIFPGGKESRSNVRNRQSGKSSPERIKQLGTKFSSNQASKLGYFFCVSKLCNRVMPHSYCSNNF